MKGVVFVTKFVPTWKLLYEERQIVSEMSGKIILYILEGQHLGYMSEKLNIHPYAVEANIDEMLYILRKQVGWRRYLRILFWK